MTPTQLTIAAIFGSLFSGGTGAVLIKAWMGRRHDEAETDDIAVKTTERVILILRQQLEEDRRRCQQDIAAINQRCSSLQLQNTEQAITIASQGRQISKLTAEVVELEEQVTELKQRP